MKLVLVFFDLRKAFDSVPHQNLLVKLQQTGLSQHVLDWISDYLSFREQRVVVNGKTSEPKAVLSGIPQGSVLGPLLFLIYIDGVAHLPLSEGSQCVLYADDLLLFRPINSNEDFSHFQHGISLVEDWVWVKCNHLTLNIAK